MRSLAVCKRVVAMVGGLAALACSTCPAQPVQVGSATYFLAPKGGDARPPAAPHRTEAMLRRAAPTNQWYSALIFNASPEVLYAQPLSVKATPAGLEMALPRRQVVPTERRDVEIHYPHAEPLLLSPVAFEPGPAKLAQASDWAIDISMARGDDALDYTVAHGSPYVSMRIGRGDARVQLPAGARRLDPGTDARVMAFVADGRHYALFGPTGVRWEPSGIPLSATATPLPTLFASVPRCDRCGGGRMFEFQLVSPIIYFLGAGSSDPLSFATLLVFTCAASFCDSRVFCVLMA